MYNISHTYKRSLFLIFKLFIVLIACFFIYKKLATNELLSFSKLKEQLTLVFTTNSWALLGILLLTDANWLLEIFKWKKIVSTLKKITFLQAYEQCLASHTAAIITPNRIGEYGVKALFFEKELRKRIVGLNFISNMSQLLATLLFGSIGLIFIFSNFTIETPELNPLKIGILIISVQLLYIFREQLVLLKIKQYIQKATFFFKKIPSIIYKKTVILAIARYLTFAHQFYFLLCLFGVETNYFTVIGLIFCVYFFASIIPSLAIFDWAIKGSIALWVFQLIGLNELTVLTVTTIMWILNFAIPALIGSIFVINFKTSHLE